MPNLPTTAAFLPPNRRSLRSIALAALATVACDPAVTPEYLGEPIVEFRGQVIESRAAATDDSTDVAVLWLTCDSEGQTEDGLCHFAGGGGGGGGIVDQDLTPEEIEEISACMTACESLPECLDYDAWGGFVGLLYCDPYLACVEGCGGSMQIQENYEVSVVDGSSSQPATVEGNFPSAFQLGIYSAPDESARKWQGFPWSQAGSANDEVPSGLAIGLVVAKGAGDVGFSSENGFTGAVEGVAEAHVIIYNEATIERASDAGVLLELDAPLPAGYHVFEYHHEPCPPFPWGSHYESFRCGIRLKLAAMDIDTDIQVRLADPGSLLVPLVRQSLYER